MVDASAYAASVAGLSAWAAGRLSMPVELVHVLGRRLAGSFDLSGTLDADLRPALLKQMADLDEQYGRMAQQKGRALLDSAKALVLEAGVSDVSVRLRNGDLLETLADLEAGAELVVIGKRGEAADFAKLHLGSNLERVVRSSTRPVLVAARAFAPFDRFLIAYDGGRSANRAVDYVAASPLLKGMKAVLLSVGAETAENRSRLEAPAALLEKAGFETRTILKNGDPDEVIGERAEAGDVGLLVMGAYGHSRIRNLVIGSTTTAMVRRCKTPVLMFR